MATRDVVGTYEDLEFNPASGTVELAPNTRLTCDDPSVIIPDRPVTVTLDSFGTALFEDVLTTDTAGVLPVGWRYRVTERIALATRRRYLIEVPAGGTPLDLAGVVPIATAPITYVYAPAMLSTKGDLLTRDTSGYVRLPAGSDGQVLSSDSGEASGLAWVSPSTGGGSGGYYEHSQSSPAATWNITHGLGYKPNVAVEDSDGNSCDALITWPTNNTVQVQLSASTSGKAHLS